MIIKKKIVIFAYGFMGKFAFESFLEKKEFEVKGIILPNANSIYSTDINEKKNK